MGPRGGFAANSSHIETAGPGKLNILGFVPRSTGSLRPTVLLLVGLLLTGAGLACFWRTEAGSPLGLVGLAVGAVCGLATLVSCGVRLVGALRDR